MNTAEPSIDTETSAMSSDLGEVAFKVGAGLAAGALGVWALDRLDWFMWDQEAAEARARTTAVRPNGEPPAQALVSKIEDATGKHLEQASTKRSAKWFTMRSA